MYDQSYNPNTLTKVLRKGDFRKILSSLRDEFRISIASMATQSALNVFNGTNPITKFHLKKKSAYKIKELKDDLVVRKLSLNLKRVTKASPRGRSFIVTNLHHFLEEGVPYRVYRLDIKSFYESFLIEGVKSRTLSLPKLSPLSKRLLEVLLDYYAGIGGQGLPRGMALSAVLSDFMMAEFDIKTFNDPEVYFYGRYVDDIIIITNHSKSETDFIGEIKQWLPEGLHFHEKKKITRSVTERPKILKPPAIPVLKFSIDYVGYQFLVFDPVQMQDKTFKHFRLVCIEIAPNKIKKIKLRIVRALIDFHKTKDASLLIKRIKYLTSNFSVTDRNTGKRNLAGIYHSYPLLSPNSERLAELDRFLRNAVLSKKGIVFSKTFPLLASQLKRRLLAQSFIHGHAHRRFVYFAPAMMSRIQECWRND